MKPIEHTNRGRVQLNHENRIQSLERRIPIDYPLWASGSMGDISNETGPADLNFGFQFQDDCTNPLDCDDQFVVQGDYLLFPTGSFSVFHLYMTAFCNGSTGCEALTEAYVPNVAGTYGQTRSVLLACDVEVWRDNEPFGFSTYRAYEDWGVFGPPTSRDSLRMFTYHKIMSNIAIVDPSRDRYALKPHVFLASDVTTPLTLTGGVLAVELSPLGQTIAGVST